jgi:hypothetical protein
MKKNYQTLDEYLDDLDAIKGEIAAETKGMNPKQVRAYFARARRGLESATEIKLRVRHSQRPVRAR